MLLNIFCSFNTYSRGRSRPSMQAYLLQYIQQWCTRARHEWGWILVTTGCTKERHTCCLYQWVRILHRVVEVRVARVLPRYRRRRGQQSRAVSSSLCLQLQNVENGTSAIIDTSSVSTVEWLILRSTWYRLSNAFAWLHRQQSDITFIHNLYYYPGSTNLKSCAAYPGHPPSAVALEVASKA